MCMQCNTDPSPTCWGACARANPKKSLIDSAVMPFCMDCAKNPTNECWTACHRAAKLVKKIESPANYCMQCDTDPSPTCWGACAATIPEPQPRCMQCDTDPSPTCWGACAKAGVMVDYESPAAYCMQCDTDPSPTCWGACARGLGLAEQSQIILLGADFERSQFKCAFMSSCTSSLISRINKSQLTLNNEFLYVGFIGIRFGQVTFLIGVYFMFSRFFTNVGDA